MIGFQISIFPKDFWFEFILSITFASDYQKTPLFLCPTAEGHKTTEREVAGSNPSRTTNQGLKITVKITLAEQLQTCLSSDDRVIGW